MARLGAHEVAGTLRRRLAAGTWLDNGRLPSERDLAKEFGVARNTVRRAMELLEDSGAITRQVGRGTFLQDARSQSVTAAIARIEGASPADMMEIRQLLEPAAAAFAATNASMAELAAIEEAHGEAERAADMPSFEHWDLEFHRRIIACARNELLKEINNLITALRHQEPWYEMKRRTFSEDRRLHYSAEHAVLISALVKRDPEGARAAMSAHLATVARNMLGR